MGVAQRQVFEDVVERQDADEPAAIVDNRHAAHTAIAHALKCVVERGRGPHGDGVPAHDVVDHDSA
jgi:hypothetical protein